MFIKFQQRCEKISFLNFPMFFHVKLSFLKLYRKGGSSVFHEQKGLQFNWYQTHWLEVTAVAKCVHMQAT